MAKIRVVIQKPVNSSSLGVQTVTGAIVDNTDPQNPVIINTSGTNTGDETTSTIQAKRPIKTVNSQSLEGIGNIEISGTDEYGYLGSYDVTDLQVDKNYVLADYVLSSDVVVGFDILTAKVGRCVYLKINADGVSKINFNPDNTANLTGINNGEVLPQGNYTLIAIFNNSTVDVSVATIDESITPIAIPQDGLAVFFDFINQSTLTINGGLITTANNIATPSYFANQGVTGFKPTFDAVRGALMDGTDDFLSSNVPSSLMDVTGNYTAFVVFQRDTPDSVNDLMYLYENSSATTSYNAAVLRSGTYRQGIYQNGGIGFVSESISVSENTRHVSYFTNQNLSIEMELDGLASTGTDPIYTGSGVASSLQLGASGGNQNYFLKGSIEKIIIYDRILTSGEKSQVLSYLNS